MKRINSKKYPHTAEAMKYARDVVAGKILACEWVRLACQRQLDDLERWSGKDAPYYFDCDAAERVINFAELFPHVKGQWARRRELLKLEPWQKFIWVVPFGWKRRSDGTRRFREIYAEIPRKNSKSTMVAPIGHYMFAADDEEGAEVYCGATTEKQAWEVFGPARLMAIRTPDYTDHFGVEVQAKNMNILGSAAKFEPLIGDPGDGASPHCAIADEYHEHKTPRQYDTMLTGMGARTQPLMIGITTAGYNLAGPCYDMRLRAQKVLQAVFVDDELFAIIYTIDEGDDWTDPAVLIKANPNYGVSVSAEFLQAQQRKAIQSPAKQNAFKTKHLNVWCNAGVAWMNMVAWDKCADPTLDINAFVGVPCWLGVDLASKIDIAAVMPLFRRGDDYYLFSLYYIPEARTQGDDMSHYAGWVEEGYITATSGSRIDFDVIEEDVRDLARAYDIQGVAHDPWNAAQFVTHLQAEKITMIEVPQTVNFLSEPMKELEALVLSGRLHHDGNPVTKWMMSNVVAQLDRKDNIFPRKEREANKIDGVVATITALRCAMAPQPNTSSVYEQRGIRTL